MSPSGAEFIRQIKNQIAQVDPGEVNEQLQNADANGNGSLAIIDVRESE
ncbi:MAG: hypothetical protein QOI64_2771 [Solirubrobacteraceae bacterium]|nr:hypothetical protein [Solirubrobacteraceae bacterium]